MNQILLHVIACSMMCIGFHAACLPGNILSPLTSWIDQYTTHPILEYLKSPIWSCLTCMCSVWGLVYFLTTFGIPELSGAGIWAVLKFVLMVGCLNFLVDLVIGVVELIKMSKARSIE